MSNLYIYQQSGGDVVSSLKIAQAFLNGLAVRQVSKVYVVEYAQYAYQAKANIAVIVIMMSVHFFVSGHVFNVFEFLPSALLSRGKKRAKA